VFPNPSHLEPHLLKKASRRLVSGSTYMSDLWLAAGFSVVVAAWCFLPPPPTLRGGRSCDSTWEVVDFGGAKEVAARAARASKRTLPRAMLVRKT
jgi:hypothetical protein